jgi:hypothetical protein
MNDFIDHELILRINYSIQLKSIWIVANVNVDFVIQRSTVNLYETCSFANVSANETFSVISSSKKDFFFDDSSFESFSFSMIFFNRLLTFLRAYLIAVLIREFVSRIFSIFFIISSFDFHLIERMFSIR